MNSRGPAGFLQRRCNAPLAAFVFAAVSAAALFADDARTEYPAIPATKSEPALSSAEFKKLANSGNQGQMNYAAGREFEDADRRLNIVYAQVLEILDSQAKAKLRVAQRAWLEHREAEAQFEADSAARGGTMAPLLRSTARTELTEDRIKSLQKLIERAGHPRVNKE